MHKRGTQAHGSSPLTRGKRADDALGLADPGLIPAHAGKTLHLTRPGPYWGAHPRSRGENRGFLLRACLVSGSSPLTRGKQEGPARRERPGRLIPAHAGKTPRSRAPRRFAPAHPRSRGENCPHRPALVALSGSSPLTRGKLRLRRGGCGCVGLIPAHAGKTFTCARS